LKLQNWQNYKKDLLLGRLIWYMNSNKST
jgi:hypothetical protein